MTETSPEEEGSVLGVIFTLLSGFGLVTVLLVLTQVKFDLKPATTSSPLHYLAWMPQALDTTTNLHAVGGSVLPPSGETERAVDCQWGPMAYLGLGFQPPKKVAIGRQAQIRIWHRLRSAILLILIVVIGGSVLAGTVGLIIFASGFLIEQAIG